MFLNFIKNIEFSQSVLCGFQFYHHMQLSKCTN